MESSQKLNLINEKFEKQNSKTDLLNEDIYNDNLAISNEIFIKNNYINEKISLKKDKESCGKISSPKKSKKKKY